MAHYILIAEDIDGDTTVTHLEAKNRHAAAREFFGEHAESLVVEEATLYRVAAAPVKVRVRTVTETRVEVE